ncbi:MAG: phage antirepressor KilAC domain-containing protein, partial [Clostridia bacterium]|nr:phage antirepressor KilAC domain-containing protein [Clostridia bacterium]
EILRSKNVMNINQIAKDYGMSGQKLNSLLARAKVQYKQNGQWLLYSKYQDKGYTHSNTIKIVRRNGQNDIRLQTKWTQKGRLFIYEFMKKNGFLPLIEQEDK